MWMLKVFVFKSKYLHLYSYVNNLEAKVFVFVFELSRSKVFLYWIWIKIFKVNPSLATKHHKKSFCANKFKKFPAFSLPYRPSIPKIYPFCYKMSLGKIENFTNRPSWNKLLAKVGYRQIFLSGIRISGISS